MSERKQAPETPWYLRPFGPLVSLALLCVVWGSLRKGPAVRAPDPGPAGLAGGEPGLRIRFGAGPDPAQLLPVLQPGQPVFGLFCPGYGGAVRRLYLPGADPLQQSRRRGNRAVYRPGLQPHLLAFDRALKTLVSYNGGEGGEAPGLNPETLKGAGRAEGGLGAGVPPGGHPPSKTDHAQAAAENQPGGQRL